MNILIISAHPDDEVYGCGGIISKLSNNNNIYILIVTDGSSSQYMEYEKYIEIKKQESENVRNLLGIKKYIYLNFPDMKLDTIEHVKLNNSIEKIVDTIKPEIVFTHSDCDLNKDHRIIYESTLVACRPSKKYIKKIYSYEVPSTTEIGVKQYYPNVYFNIDEHIDNKIKGIECYKTELRDYPHGRNKKSVKALSKYRGYSSNNKYAEAFILVKEYIL